MNTNGHKVSFVSNTTRKNRVRFIRSNATRSRVGINKAQSPQKMQFLSPRRKALQPLSIQHKRPTMMNMKKYAATRNLFGTKERRMTRRSRS